MRDPEREIARITDGCPPEQRHHIRGQVHMLVLAWRAEAARWGAGQNPGHAAAIRYLLATVTAAAERVDAALEVQS